MIPTQLLGARIGAQSLPATEDRRNGTRFVRKGSDIKWLLTADHAKVRTKNAFTRVRRSRMMASPTMGLTASPSHLVYLRVNTYSLSQPFQLYATQDIRLVTYLLIKLFTKKRKEKERTRRRADLVLLQETTNQKRNIRSNNTVLHMGRRL